MTRKKKTEKVKEIQDLLELEQHYVSEDDLALSEETNPEAPESILEPSVELPVEEVLVEEEVAPEPAVEVVEATIAPEPLQGTAGQGSWHNKYNAARNRKFPAARKYIPVHRQR